MGGVFLTESPPPDQDDSIINKNDFIVITNTLETNLHFDPNQSRILSIGIDKQFHPQYKDKSLGPTVKLDALEVSLALVKQFHLKEFDVFCSSDNPDQCTHNGIQQILKESAQKVGQEGLFVVFFGGHGVNDSSQEWALAPADFDLTSNTYLNARTLNACLAEVQCKAKYILIILDCCYSGAMATIMTEESGQESILLPHMYVLAAGTAYQSSLSIGPLKHTIFSFFLNYAIYKVPNDIVGVLPLKDVYEECKVCCNALSSLILRLENTDNKLKLKVNKAVPSLAHFNPIVSKEYTLEDIDAPSHPAGRLIFIMKLLEKQKHSCNPFPKLPLHPSTHEWLRNLIQYSPSPLALLEEKGLLMSTNDTGCVLKAVIGLMMQSIALMELVHNRDTVGNPNTFLIAFINTIAILDMIHPFLPVEIEHLSEGWAFYHHILVENKVDDGPMKELFKLIVLEQKEREMKVCTIHLLYLNVYNKCIDNSVCKHMFCYSLVNIVLEYS